MFLYISEKMAYGQKVKNQKKNGKEYGRRPDVTTEYKNKNRILLACMVCPSDNNVDAKHAEMVQKQPQLAFGIRETITVQFNNNHNCYWLLR